MGKYEVKVLNKVGACNSNIFEKMAKAGDVTAEKVTACVDRIVKITGYAMCEITTEEKTFQIGYYATNEGFISSGSEILYKSVENYFGDVERFKIVKVKTKQGNTYKVVPILEVETENEKEETTNEVDNGSENDMPF